MSKRRGFTLVEVLLVVVLIGILAAIAVVAYRRHVNASKMAEASHNIVGIAIAQQAYKAERGVYVNVSGSLSNLYPAQAPGMFKTGWGGPCATCLRPWTSLAFQPDAPVSFGYATVASRSAVPQEVADPGSSSSSSGFGGSSSSSGDNHFGVGPGNTDPTSIPDPDHPGEYLPDATGPYFTIIAKGDADGNGVYSSALYYSETNHIVFDLEGE